MGLTWNVEPRNKEPVHISINDFDDVQVTQAELDHLYNILDDISELTLGRVTPKGKVRKDIKEKFNKIL